MESMLRWLAGLLVVAALAFGILYLAAGRSTPPRLTIDKPDRVVGQTGTVEVTAEEPNARFPALTIALEQNGKSYPLYTLSGAGTPTDLTALDRNRVRVARPIGKQNLQKRVAGLARLVVSATRPSCLNLRKVTSSVTKDFQVRLEPPRIGVLSTKHYPNHSGAGARGSTGTH